MKDLRYIRSKIAFKLALFFAISLLVFSAVIGIVFITLEASHTVDIKKDDLKKRADVIASSFSSFMQSSVGMGGYSQDDEITRDGDTSDHMRQSGGHGFMGGYGNGYGAYLRFIGDIAMTDVWVVDNSLNLLTSNASQGIQTLYDKLPDKAIGMLKEALNGKTVFSKDFSGMLSGLTLTVCTPITLSNGKIAGVVLLHSPIDSINDTTNSSILLLLISLSIALVIAVTLSLYFSLSFTKPLNRIKSAAVRLAAHDYFAKTNVNQSDEIGELANTIDILANRLYSASLESDKLTRLRQDFIANISHELKTPVTVIRGSAEALVDNIVTSSEMVQEYHTQILNETVFLQRLIGDLLDLSKLQNVDFVIEKRDYPVYQILQDVVSSGSKLADARSVTITLDRRCNDFTLCCDYGRIRQMLMIVLDNAIKFTPTNGEVNITFDNGIILIRDHGEGIPESDLPYIFDKFYKQRSEENKNGTGLGLSIAKQIANRHSIGLFATNDKDGGAVFIFRFF